MQKNNLILIIGIAFLISLNYIYASDLMALEANIYNSDGSAADGNITIEIWTSASGGALVYNSTGDFIDNVTQGKVDIVLGGSTQAVPLNLTYGGAYFMEVYINNNDINFSGFDRQEFQSSVGNITFNNINVSTSIIPDDNITLDLGSASTYFKNIFVETVNLLTKIATSQIADNAITAALIASSAVNSTHIAEATILPEDISSVGWTNLSDYPAACPAGQAVTTIGDTLTCAAVSSISGSDILWSNETSNINTTHIVDRTITLDDIADSAVNTTHIVDGTIAASDLDSTLDISNYTAGAGIQVSNHIITNLLPYDTLNIAFTNQSNIFADIQDFNIIKAQDWTNVSITESQINNLQSYLLASQIVDYPNWTEANLTYIESFGIDQEITGNLTITNNLTVLGDTQLKNFAIQDDLIIGSNNISSTWIGIGTLTPAQTLNIIGAINITGDMFLSTSSLSSCSGKLITSADGNITCGTDATGSGMDYANIAMLNSTSDQTFVGNVTFTDNLTVGSALYVDSSNSRVGIGTTSPSALLDVYGTGNLDINLTGMIYANSTNIMLGSPYGHGATGVVNVRSGVPGQITRIRMVSELNQDDNTNTLEFHNETSQLYAIITDRSANRGENLDIHNSGGGSLMTWTQSGNVGIGTTSPTHTLTVIGAGNFTTNSFFDQNVTVADCIIFGNGAQWCGA